MQPYNRIHSASLKEHPTTGTTVNTATSKSGRNVANLDHVNMPWDPLSKIWPDDGVTSPSILFTRGKLGACSGNQ